VRVSRFLLAEALVIIFLLAVLIWFYPSTKDFSAANPSWNGGGHFCTKFEALPINSYNSLPPFPQGTTLIVIPYQSFIGSELERLEDYVSGGGSLISLDDYGYGNEILRYLEVEPRFTREPLLDALFNYKNDYFPKITRFAQTSLAEGVKSIVLNHASSLSDVPDNEVRAWSSRFSFLDQNGNQAWDEGEPRGPHPVAAEIGVGEGCVILVADPSLIINSMRIDDNYSFIRNAIEIQTPEPQVLIDQCHLPGEPLD